MLTMSYVVKIFGGESNNAPPKAPQSYMTENVKLIFNMYLQGKSVIGIVSELVRLMIKPPTGKDRWYKLTIDVMHSNENTKERLCCWMMENESYDLSENNNPAIISKEMFQAVKIEKQCRSNMTKGENCTQRKSKNTA